MKTVAIKTDLIPASFESATVRMTQGQLNLLKMLSKHIENRQPIKREDIIAIYCSTFFPKGIKVHRTEHWNGEAWTWKVKEVNAIEHFTSGYYYATPMQWFKNNLGSCIIKGKILAVPIIET